MLRRPLNSARFYWLVKKKIMQNVIIIFCFVFHFLIGCTDPNMKNVVSKDTTFELLEYFDGETMAWGRVVDGFGH